MNPKIIYAEDTHYWMTGSSAPDKWIDSAKKLIAEAGGKILMEAFGKDADNHSAFMLAFEIQDNQFKIVWPVLPTRGKNDRAAKVQAATFLYHDIKAKCMSAMVLGFRAAFFSYMVLPDGHTATEFAADQINDLLPDLFKANKTPRLQSGGDDFIDGDVREI